MANTLSFHTHTFGASENGIEISEKIYPNRLLRLNGALNQIQLMNGTGGAVEALQLVGVAISGTYNRIEKGDPNCIADKGDLLKVAPISSGIFIELGVSGSQQAGVGNGFTFANDGLVKVASTGNYVCAILVENRKVANINGVDYFMFMLANRGVI